MLYILRPMSKLYSTSYPLFLFPFSLWLISQWWLGNFIACHMNKIWLIVESVGVQCIQISPRVQNLLRLFSLQLTVTGSSVPFTSPALTPSTVIYPRLHNRLLYIHVHTDSALRKPRVKSTVKVTVMNNNKRHSVCTLQEPRRSTVRLRMRIVKCACTL